MCGQNCKFFGNLDLIRTYFGVGRQFQYLGVSANARGPGSAKIQSLYRVSTIRPLLASQHETRVQFGIPTNNAVQIQKIL